MTLPIYQCHKRVQASKVLATSTGHDGDKLISVSVWVADGEPIELDGTSGERFLKAMEARADKDDAGYLVIYEDGYTSWSPSAAFEAGYKHACAPDTYRSSVKVRAWRNCTWQTDMPAWVLGASELRFNTTLVLDSEQEFVEQPQAGHIMVNSELLGRHVCQPGDWLVMQDGHIGACSDEVFRFSYELESAS